MGDEAKPSGLAGLRAAADAGKILPGEAGTATTGSVETKVDESTDVQNMPGQTGAVAGANETVEVVLKQGTDDAANANTTQTDIGLALKDSPGATNKPEGPPILDAEGEAAAAAENAENQIKGIYSCLPIQNWRIGDFYFRNGQLKLESDEEVEAFEKLLNAKSFPLADRIKIKKIDLDLAERIARDSLPAATRGMDGGHSQEEENLRKKFPKLGTVDQGSKGGGN